MEMMGTVTATIVLEAINATLEKKPTRIIHRRIAPELIVRESTRSVK
jgi:DNA-binding LacI/PurR family transcriptional regulator